MTVLDAYAVLAYLLDAQAADEVRLLLDEDDPATISAVNLAEVVDRLIRLTGIPPEEVLSGLEPLLDGALSVSPVTAQIGLVAGSLRGRRYRKRDLDVSTADCVARVTAGSRGLPLSTADRGLAAMARAEGIQVVALPDSQGRRP